MTRLVRARLHEWHMECLAAACVPPTVLRGIAEALGWDSLRRWAMWRQFNMETRICLAHYI